MDRKSCMRREGRMPVAARRRPESSGLHKPFPHSGNDNYRYDNPTCHPITPAIPALPSLASSAACSRRRSTTYIPVGVDSSLRWNDDGGGNGFVVIPIAPLLFLPNADLQPPSSFRRRPESSGLDKPFPRSGNDNHRHDNRACHPTNPATPSPPRPPLLGGLFPTPLYHLHPCRRGFQPALE